MTDLLPAGLSLITACHDRAAFLRRSLPTWLRLPAEEIIVVDWASPTPLTRAALGADPRIRLVRVETDEGWHLPSAYNLGIRLARHATIVKLDCDVTAQPWFAQVNRIGPSTFLAGDWRHAAAGQQHLNGSFMAPHSALMATGGFNEWLQGYGWDDDDLYDRLQTHGLTRRLLAPGSLFHHPHPDALRTDSSGDSPALRIQTNRALARIMPPWDARSPARHYTEIAGDTADLHLTVAPRIGAPRHFLAMARRLAPYALLPPEAASLSPAAARRALTQPPAPAIARAGAPIYLEVAHGLGNRLRVLASGMALAAAVQRPLHLIWPRDVHCAADAHDLLHLSLPCTDTPAYDPGMTLHDATEGPTGNRPHPITFAPNRAAYIRSATVLNHPAARNIRPQLRHLQPAAPVTALLAGQPAQFALAAHIRAETTAPADDPRQWAASSGAAIAHWRGLAGADRFIARLSTLTGPIVLATDTAAIRSALTAAFGRRVTCLAGAQYGTRSRAQVIHAFAEMLLLARGAHFLASGWSAFSELAHLLAPETQQIEIAGRDF
ncbi:putative glycosyltransferase [Ketogulonicigenium robustum]|uniref:Putative glycosyltransferase n=1 Tax=Ketogulonicigenium robustum TaxID=92947 RepID=A0A1W6P1V1_9RHOB|nr:galactosyltransferase-related protein [Ketogulonicigenium robustum]ARO15488.1 putative glycosyltransferase [Ketogulonicigenium robustum]